MALYGEGLRIAELSREFGVCTGTAAHLVRRPVPMRQRRLAAEDTLEAVRLHASGLTLMGLGPAPASASGR